MSKPLSLTMACGLYDRMLDLYRGAVVPDGIDLRFIDLDGSYGAREIFDRMGGNLEFDLADWGAGVEPADTETARRRKSGHHHLGQWRLQGVGCVDIDC